MLVSMRSKLLSFLALLLLALIIVFSYFIETVVLMNPGMTALRPELDHLTAWLMLALIVLAAILLLAADAFLTIQLVRRLKQLEAALRGVKDVRSLTPFGFNKRYPDEISHLADEVTDMMDRLRQSEESHRSSETQFKILFDSIPQGMVLREYVRDADGNVTDYRIIDMNPAYAELLSVNREASIGRMRSEAFPNVTADDWVVPLLPEVLAGRPQFLRRHSALLDRHMHVSVHSFGHDRVAVGFTDMTERVQQTTELEARNRGLQDLLQAAERLLDTPGGGLDYDYIVRQSRELFGAAGVILSIARYDIKRLETVAYSADSEATATLEQLFGLGLLGSTWEWHIDEGDLEIARVVSYDSLARFLSGQIDDKVAETLQQRLSLGAFHILELSHRGRALGNMVISMDVASPKLDPDVLTVFTRMLSAVMLRGQAETALRDSETQHRAFIEAAPVCILVTDLQGNITIANEQAAWLHGYATGEDMVGTNTINLVHEDDRQTVRQQMAERLDGRVQRHLERRLLRVDGSHFPAEVTARAITTAAGQPVGQLLISQDITVRKQAEDKLVYLSLHDPLTGLYNRAYFVEELHRLQHGRQYPVSIIGVDVNGLKLINDTFGHAMGDSLLRAAALVLKQALRKSDTLSRVGGDEFALSLPIADAAVAESVIARIREAVRQHNAVALCAQCDESTWIPLSLSLGAATAQDASVSLEDLFGLADNRMYQDKQAQGKDYLALLAQAVEDGRFEARPRDMTDGSGDRVSREQLIAILKDRGRQ